MVECPQCNTPLVLRRNASTDKPYYKCYECDEAFKVKREYHDFSDSDIEELEEEAVVY